MRIRFVVILLMLIPVSCKDKPKQQVSEAEQVLMDAGFDTGSETYLGQYKRYTGKIAGQDVVLNMVRYGDAIHAGYYYTNIGRNITLYSMNDTAGDSLQVFIESAPGVNAAYPPVWHISLWTDTIAGVWLSGDGIKKRYDILLIEDTNDNIQRFGVMEFRDSTRFTDTLPEPYAQFVCTVLLPIGKDDRSGFVRNVILENIACPAGDSGNINKCLSGKKQEYFRAYRETVNEPDKEFALSPMNNWSRDVGYSVVYNDKGYVVLDNYMYEYSGGAHGNYSSSYINIDRDEQKLLELEDILSVDSNRLLELLEVQARVNFGLNEKQALSARMFNDELHIPENFYIGSKGITFVYGLYEIASYADGIIELYIPYNKLSDMLTPTFKQRMQLEQVAVK